MSFVDLFVEVLLGGCHWHFKLNLGHFAKVVLEVEQELLNHVGVKDLLDLFELPKRPD